MAKYQVLRRSELLAQKDANNVLIPGRMVEFLQIPGDDVAGPSQVQTYFVAESESEDDILSISAQHHEDELRAGRGAWGTSPAVHSEPVEPEPIVEVDSARVEEILE